MPKNKDLEELAELGCKVQAGFPELNGRQFRFIYRRTRPWAGWDGNNTIYLSLRIKKSKKTVKKGYYAHEFAHIVCDLDMSDELRRRDRRLSNNPAYELQDERNADTIAVMHGYGKELIASKISAYVMGYPHNYGLKIKEIKKLMHKR